MEEWKNSSTILILGARWKGIINFKIRSFYGTEGSSGTDTIRGSMVPRGGLDATEKKNLVPVWA